MTTQHSEEILKAVEKALGEPAFSEFSENTWKIRTNLIIASVVSITVVFADLHIDPDSTILGLKFRGLSDTVLTNGLIAVTAYLLVHFLWCSIDSLLEWRLRVTGTRVAFVTTAVAASEHGDYPKNPRQSTLYNWWLYESKKIGDISGRLSEVDTKLAECTSRLETQFTEKPDAMNIVNATKSISSTREELSRLQQAVTASKEALLAARVPVSLSRFDSWFELFLRSQNLRWLLVEFLFPVLAGAYALCLLFAR